MSLASGVQHDNYDPNEVQRMRDRLARFEAVAASTGHTLEELEVLQAEASAKEEDPAE